LELCIQRQNSVKKMHFQLLLVFNLSPQVKLVTISLDNILFENSDIGKYRNFSSFLSKSSFTLYLYFV